MAARNERSEEVDGNTTNIVTSGDDGWNSIIRKVQALRRIPRDQDATVIVALTRHLDELPPPYAYELARRLCVSDPEKASYVFALAGSRARYDALR